MAIQFKFICNLRNEDYLTAEENDGSIVIKGFFDGDSIQYRFDKTTCIRFAKTLRTEINKIEEGNNV
jgi:hypothetical protein